MGEPDLPPRVIEGHVEFRMRGCSWAKLNTWEFQAPDFYARCGYVVYGRETDFPPGHTNHLMRKDLLIRRIDDAR